MTTTTILISEAIIYHQLLIILTYRLLIIFPSPSLYLHFSYLLLFILLLIFISSTFVLNYFLYVSSLFHPYILFLFFLSFKFVSSTILCYFPSILYLPTAGTTIQSHSLKFIPGQHHPPTYCWSINIVIKCKCHDKATPPKDFVLKGRETLTRVLFNS